jgi:transcriptional regulator with XRE-family HTH domain
MKKTTAIFRRKNVLGPFIKASRKAKDLSLDELARQTGLSRSYLGDIEAGRKGSDMPGHTVSLLAHVLDVPTSLITVLTTRNEANDARKYGEYYRVLRSNVRAKQIARHIERLRLSCRQAREPLLPAKEVSKLLQDIEKTVENLDKTLAYRGRPPVSVQPAGDLGDEEKFLDGKLSDNGKY